MAFPTLSPDGKGDPTNISLPKNVTLKEKIKHLLKFADRKDNKWQCRFASHPRFYNWALNMIQRKQILQQTGIFFKQNPGEQHLTLDELREIVQNNEANVLLTKVSRYITNITGSDTYWFKAKEDLRENVPEDHVISVKCGTCFKNSKSSYFAQRYPMMSQQT